MKIIENSQNIEEDVADYVENDQEFKEHNWDVLQFIYMGYGIHKGSP